MCNALVWRVGRRIQLLALALAQVLAQAQALALALVLALGQALGQALPHYNPRIRRCLVVWDARIVGMCWQTSSPCPLACLSSH